jgi:hypothetical protein
MSILNAKYFRSDTALTNITKWEETYTDIVLHLDSTLSRSKDTVIAANVTLEKKRTRIEYPQLFHTVINHKLSDSSQTVDEATLQFLTHQNIRQFITDICERLPEFMSIPRAPPHISDVPARLKLIQVYLEQLSYNHLGHQFFEVKKTYSLRRLHLLAREMINEGMPIKCLEAVVVAMHLTNSCADLDRFVLGFKSQVGDETYRHIVLVVRYNQTYGALGLSRRKDLMYKNMEMDSLHDLVMDYKKSYENNGHVLIKVKLGKVIPKDVASNEKLPFKHISIDLRRDSVDVVKKQIDLHARETMRSTYAVSSWRK